MAFRTPYLMFLGDAADQLAAKTAQGVVDWRPDICLGQLSLEGCNADLGLTEMSLGQAYDAGARTLILGVANRGGIITVDWLDTLREAIELGFDIASGLHNRLTDISELVNAAEKNGTSLTDVRLPTREFPVASGIKRSGNRLLTVGTDCSVGKMYTALALEAEMKKRGMNVSFRATGQTGIFITGRGVSVDAVISDFVSGATEWLTPENAADHWDVIEGQGSLFHASFAGVSLGLLHGAQADALVLCHEPTRPHMRGLPAYRLPDIADCIRVNVQMARLTNPAAQVIGISVNTKALDKQVALDYLDKLEQQYSLPAVDPFVTGVATLVDKLAS